MPKAKEPINLKARLDPDVHRAMKSKLASEGRSFQDLMEEAVHLYLSAGGAENHKTVRDPEPVRKLRELLEKDPAHMGKIAADIVATLHGSLPLRRGHGGEN